MQSIQYLFIYIADIIHQKMKRDAIIFFAIVLTIAFFIWLDIRLVKSTGLQDFEKKFKIYPNPAKDNLLISLEEFTEKQVTLSIYDSRGKLLITENIESFSEVNVSNFSKGVYFITIGSDSEIFTSKFVKL